MRHSNLVRLSLLGMAGIAAGCVFAPPAPDFTAMLEPEPVPATAPDPQAERLPALDSRSAALSADQRLIGDIQVLFTRHENTFAAIAREYGIGYDELRDANPTVDHWLPGEDTPVFLPTRHLLPEVEREGIVINVASMRLFHFGDGEVRTYPIGIGREGWATPTGVAQVTQKARDPSWYVPASVRAEHEAAGDPLPRVVPPGPDNPLGGFAIALSMPGYLIHGTNKPSGVGMRVSHGCVRLYPEDIESLFGRVPIGTPVRIVNQPVLVAWHDGQLYLEVHAPLTEDERDLAAEADTLLAAALAQADPGASELDTDAVRAIVTGRRGLPFPVLRTAPSHEEYLARARVIENTVPTTIAEEAAAQLN
jgi:L,D-transpeptidase ErfK/SrfK